MKKVILSLLIISSISIFIGCNNSNNNEKSSVSKDNSTTISNDNKKSITKLNNEDKNTESKSISINSNDKKNSNSSTSTNINIENMLKDIKTKALKGEIINSNFKLKESIDTVISKLGKPSSQDYISSAKGTYFTFNSNNLSFGCNKGNEIFEIRSLDKDLNILNLSDIKDFFGTPNYNITTKENERIIGYKITDKIKLLFVFNKNTNKLKHYSVLYPSLTKNSMADDKGRSW